MTTGDEVYYLKVNKLATCRACKAYLSKGTGYITVSPNLQDGYHLRCIPRLVQAEKNLARIKKEYGIEISLEGEVIPEEKQDG